MITILLGVLEEGLVYAIMALGVYITYKILDFPDLSVDSKQYGNHCNLQCLLENMLAELFCKHFFCGSR